MVRVHGLNNHPIYFVELFNCLRHLQIYIQTPVKINGKNFNLKIQFCQWKIGSEHIRW